MSRIRSNQITNQSADGAPVVQNGLVITGVTTSTNVSIAESITATSFFGSGAGLTGVASTDNIITGTAATFNNLVNVGSNIKIDATSGIVTATAFYGSGQNLTNLPAGGDSLDVTASLFI